jgi:hypothetical protein
MFIVISVLLIILAYFVHESIGHAGAMKASGIHVTKIIFGFPYGPSVSFPLRGKWSGTDFVIYSIPFGAFTMCDKSEIQKLPYWEKVRICAGGPVASIIFGCFLFILSGFVVMIENGMPYYPNVELLIKALLIIAIGGIIMRFGGKVIFTFLVPIVPIALLFYLGYGLFENTTQVTNVVGLISVMKKVSEFSGALFFVGGFSINWFGVTMLLPLRIFGYPLDGEQIINPIVEKYTPRMLDLFEKFGTFIVGFLILYTLQIELAPIFLAH